MAITIVPSQQPFDEADFKRRLADEYKILQDKIDKIGGFRFTIKGWSVTAVIAASAAGSASRNPLTVTTVSLGLAFMLWFFFRFELEQVKLSRLFGDRVRALEETFRTLDRNKGTTTSAPILVPYTGHEIGQARYLQKQLAKQVSREHPMLIGLWRKWTGQWHIFTQADIRFYLMLIVLTFCPLLPYRHQIYKQVKQLWHWAHVPEPALTQQPGMPEC
jgi:hypothetical protein